MPGHLIPKVFSNEDGYPSKKKTKINKGLRDCINFVFVIDFNHRAQNSRTFLPTFILIDR